MSAGSGGLPDVTKQRTPGARLAYLALADGCSTTQEVAEWTGLSYGGAHGGLRQLEHAEMVTQRPDPENPKGLLWELHDVPDWGAVQ